MSRLNGRRRSPTRGRAADPLDSLYARPGFLLRRAHQIAVGIFVEECGAIGLTPPQHGVMLAVERCPGLNQAGLARVLGYDRATLGQVVEVLESRGLIKRASAENDRRNKAIDITPEGARLMRRVAEAMRRTSERLLSPFSASERKLLMDFLDRLTSQLNASSRTPVINLNGQ
jgi:DNA-binding MarR family transcriptional regulator